MNKEFYRDLRFVAAALALLGAFMFWLYLESLA